ncbi:hypothetical protein F4861DRAFT_37886 [Xylaria intraflava]|nr:hypothetical protein F4861DRAFT_37886 [Xylaria intraflava]
MLKPSTSAPMMEQHRFPRRSASHGMLRTSSSHGSLCAGRSTLHPLHKPLRSVNENSVLLHSPGALESMLKTTTETGDIGIFTIKSVPPSPLREPLRDTRPSVGYPYPRPHRSVDNMYRQNLAMRPTCHQDTISEAFSIHESDSLKSGTGTLSPNSTDDPEKRSYSMTTCGSRHLSHFRSTNTLQSQASVGSNLQRPRSPFPYPTRLKRPGVRPASPAVTENGRIDYSRMVEIDRVSYRTVHGHFKHTDSPMARRPLPLGLRAEDNLSTPSLAPPGPPPNFHGPPRPPSSVGTHSPASLASWNPPFRERFDSASMRTSSLTSVTNMQHRMPLLPRVDRSYTIDAPPRYYDYTEDFENKPPRSTPSTQSFASPPLHAVRYDQSIMLRKDGIHLAPGHLDTVFRECDSAFDCENQDVDEQDVLPVLTVAPQRSESFVDTSSILTPCRPPDAAQSHNSTIEHDASETGSKNTRCSDIDLLPSQIGRDSIDTFVPSLDFELRDMPPTYNYVAYRASTNPKPKTNSPERHVQVLGGQALTIRSEQGIIFRDDAHCDGVGEETPDIYRSSVDIAANEPCSPSQFGGTPMNKDLTNEDVRDACEVLVRDETEHEASSSGNAGGLVSVAASNSPKSETSRSLSMAETVATSGAMIEKKMGHGIQNEKSETNHREEFRCHKRSHAVLRISTTNLPRDDNEGHPHIPPSCSTVPLVSPKPISPARQLKVKNSIPQLMKALPPIPGAIGYDPPSTAIDALEEDEFAEILVPFDFSGLDNHLQIDQSQRSHLKPITSDHITPDGPKFRLKIKTTSCSETLDSEIHERQKWRTDEKMSRSEGLSGTEFSDELGEKQVRSRNRNRLKIRSSRRSVLSASHSSTVRHNPGAEKSRIVADLIQHQPRDLFNTPPKSEAVMPRKHRKPLPKPVYPQAIATSITSDSIPSEDRVASASYQVSSTISTSNTMPSIDRDTIINSMPSHGLLKRLSNLRALLTASTASGPRLRATDSLRVRRISSNALPSADFNPMKMNDSLATESIQRRLGQRIRAKIFRWIRHAKTGMRKRATKKSSEYGQEEIEQT